MLDRLHSSLEAFLRSESPLPTSAVDVSFDTPDNDWGAKLVRPTVNLFLHDVKRSTNRSVTGTFVRQSGDGAHRRDALAPFVRLRYLLTVWTTESTDAYELLGSLLTVVTTSGHVPADYLESPLDLLGNRVEIALLPEEAGPVALWGPLGIAPRPSIDFALVMPVAPPMSRVVPAPPTEIDMRTSDRTAPSRGSFRSGPLTRPSREYVETEGS